MAGLPALEVRGSIFIMRISRLLRQCVAFVAIPKVDGSFDIRGTGFFVAKPVPSSVATPVGKGLHRLDAMFLYFVTARHVIEGARSLGADQIAIRVDVPGFEPRFLPCAIADFQLHEDPTVDIAIVHTHGNPMHGTGILPWIYSNGRLGDSMLLDTSVGLGSPVSIIGLFKHHYGSQRNLPIVRTGNIAALPEERVNTRMGLMEAFLIEARSIGGLSGSPVFVHKPAAFTSSDPESITGIQLLGLMHGHYDEVFDAGADAREKVNLGIGIVAPVFKLRELLSSKIAQDDEAQRIEELRKGRG
jgi:hypothetical protein